MGQVNRMQQPRCVIPLYDEAKRIHDTSAQDLKAQGEQGWLDADLKLTDADWTSIQKFMTNADGIDGSNPDREVTDKERQAYYNQLTEGDPLKENQNRARRFIDFAFTQSENLGCRPGKVLVVPRSSR